MAALFKAEHPVTDTLSKDTDFNAAVDSANKNPNTIYASNLSEQSYLDISSGSLDNMTANGTMTRGEFVYMLVQQYFKSDYDAADPKADCFEDTINGGDIASKQKFIEDGTAKKYWQSYELVYSLQNPDKGCPERMYKALVVAFNKGIIQDTNSRWDEALSKSDFMELLTNTYSALPTVTNADRGTMEELAVDLTDTTTEESTTGVDSTGVDVQLTEDEYQGTRPEDDGQPAESTLEKPADYVETERTTDDVLADLKEYYEQGIFTKEQYESLVQAATGQSSSSSSSSGGYSQKPLTPEQQAAVDAMTTTGKDTEHRTNIDYSNVDGTGLEHIRIN